MANLSNINNILRVSSSGVGINKNNTGPSELDIESAGADMIDMTRTNLKTYRLAISGASDFSIFDVTANDDRLTIDSSGDVGIGTSSPYKKLEVVGDLQLDASNANMWIKSGATGTNGFINWTFDSNDTVYNKIGIDYDTRASTGFHIDAGYPLTLDCTGYIDFKRSGGTLGRWDSTGLGIGTTSPANKLDVDGVIRARQGQIISDNVFIDEKQTIYFTNGTADLNVDIVLPNASLWGYLEVDTTGFYSNQNALGKLTKIYGIGLNVGGTIFSAQERISDSLGSTPDNIHLGPVRWDSATSTYRIRIAHIVSSGNRFTVKISMVSPSGKAINLANAWSLSAAYTQSTSGLVRQEVYYNNKVGIGTDSPSSKLTVKDSQDSSFDSGIGIIRSNSSQTGYINMVGGAMNINAPNAVPIKFRDGGNTNVTIGGDGYVGIGTTVTDGGFNVNNTTAGSYYNMSNSDSGNYKYTNQGGRLLTSNATGWFADGRDPILTLSSSGNSNNSAIGNSIGLNLYTNSATHEVWSPLITFSALSDSGNYASAYAAIAGRKVNIGPDTNWNTGDLCFWTTGPEASNPASYMQQTPTITIKSGGNVLKPKSSAFSASTTTPGFSVGTTEVKIAYDTENVDTNGNYDTTNYRFTAPVTGNYLIGTTNSCYISTGVTVYMAVYIRKNGVATSYRFRGGGVDNDVNDWFGISGSVVVPLAAGDYIELWGYANAGSFQIVNTEGHFYGYLIG